MDAEQAFLYGHTLPNRLLNKGVVDIEDITLAHSFNTRIEFHDIHSIRVIKLPILGRQASLSPKRVVGIRPNQLEDNNGLIVW